MVECYLVNAFSESLSFKRSEDSCIVRDNLTVVPEVLQYSKRDVKDYATLFSNNMGASISIQKMGDYGSRQEAIAAYEMGDKDYRKIYELFLNKIHPQGKDSEWNMLLIVDPDVEDKIVNHYCYIIKSFDLRDYQTFNFLDACMIFQTLKIIQEFVQSFKQRSKLTKVESFLLGYYFDILNTIKEPHFFLINQKEIEYMHIYYDLWKMNLMIEGLTNNITSTIEIYDFTSQYESNKKSKLSSRMFSILTIILGFTTLYNFFENYQVIRIAIAVFFGTVSFLIFISSMLDVYKYFKELLDYRRKIR